MWIALYFIAAIAVVGFSIILSNYVDLLDKKTNLSGAFLGGILLAAVTSLPELFTSITATLVVKNNALVLGNILGSDLFDFVLFFIIYAIFFRSLVNAKVGKNHLISMIFVGVLYACCAIGCFVFDKNHILLGWFNPISIVILVIYVISIWKTPKIEEPDDDGDEVNSKLTVKQIWVLFILFSILLIGSSIGITMITDQLVATYDIGKTFGGALFLGVATSLPEMTATINLCRKKNFNAAYGDIIGSSIFNFFILTIGDLLSFNAGPLYKLDQSTFLLLVLGGSLVLIILLTVIHSIKKGIKNNLSNKFIYIGVGILAILIYIAYVGLSNIDLGLAFAPFIV